MTLIFFFSFSLLSKVDVKLCNQKVAQQQRMEKQKNENCKIFIGGLPHGVSDDEIINFINYN